MKFIAKNLVALIEIIERHTPKSFHIFHIEDILVLVSLSLAAILSGGNYIEWVGVIAVFLSFKHTVIAFRLEDVIEKREEHGDTAFNSHGNQTYYFYAKESIWFIYFFLLGAWSALVGVVIFLLYPLWHDARIKYHTGIKHKKQTTK